MKTKYPSRAKINKVLTGPKNSADESLVRVYKLFMIPNIWIKHGFDEKNSKGEKVKFCLLGAIKEINGEFESKVADAIALAIIGLYPKRMHPHIFTRQYFSLSDLPSLVDNELKNTLRTHAILPTFNDDPNTTLEDILNVLDRAQQILYGNAKFKSVDELWKEVCYKLTCNLPRWNDKLNQELWNTIASVTGVKEVDANGKKKTPSFSDTKNY